MTTYKKIKNVDKFFKDNMGFGCDSLQIEFSETRDNCWPADKSFVIANNGSIFYNPQYPLEDIKIWVDIPYTQWVNDGFKNKEIDTLAEGLITEVLSVLFSSSKHENPALNTRSLSGKAASFLMSKILRSSDFAGFDMRAKIWEDKTFTKKRTGNVLKITRNQ